VRTLVRYTGLSERTVRACLGRLEAAGLIRPCDSAVVAARVKRTDRRPKGWDLDLGLVRDDLAQEDVAALEYQFPGLAARLAAKPSPGHHVHGVQSPHPVGAVDNPATGVQSLHPVARAGCNQRRNGVQPLQSRGAVIAPEPYKEPSQEPAAPAREGPHASGAAGGGRPVGEFFAALGPDWRLTAAQRARLTPAVSAALHAGWMPQALAAVVSANTTGVRSPYAVLAGPALARPTGCTARATSHTPAVVRSVRRGHADAGLRRRRPPPVPALQAVGRNEPRGLAESPQPGPLRGGLPSRMAA
jgi:hypothetical protein